MVLQHQTYNEGQVDLDDLSRQLFLLVGQTRQTSPFYGYPAVWFSSLPFLPVLLLTLMDPTTSKERERPKGAARVTRGKLGGEEGTDPEGLG